ncbi:MAG: TonB-dependent receptor [Flavobacteriales bacterium]|nr:TonB-dependent receptor [Flavobacteriales bacterium]MCB9204474.1 TonB-dependent receptor [Flavobacteriales bacterium]
MRRFTLILFAVMLTAVAAHAQKTRIYGVVKDASSAEPLISANVVYAEGKGVVTDLDGRYFFDVENGDYTIQVTYIGYESKSQTVKANGGQLELNFGLSTITLNEVKVVADIALDRETPVAFSNIEPAKIKQELSSQEIPMLLNSTPGVYATQQGGGAGDARVTIRGFSQRNISVQIDGVPMNDMENGWVYWSNWFGLDGVTQRIQVQRGLGASKLSIPAVGGSMNIITSGITSKRSTEINLTVGNNGLIRTNISYNSGRLPKGWGVTAAFAYDRQNGWVDATWASRFFYFVKLQKQIGNHTLSVSGMGAPQERGQRSWMQPIFMYDRDYAASLGVDLDHTSVTSNPLYGNYGTRYNQQWGNIIRNRYDSNAMMEQQNVAVNFYHKPIFNFKHFWAKDKWAVSNIIYGSFGKGGGTQLRGNTAAFDAYGQYDLTALYSENITGTQFVPPFDTSAVNDTSQYKSRNFILANMNNHYWYGLLSTVNHKFNSAWDLAVGVDFRSFWVERYSTPYDLLGGDYAVINPTTMQGDLFDPSDNVKREGDVAGYRANTNVYTAGVFAQLEYSKDKISGFISLSGANNSYKRSDQYRKRDLVLSDTTYLQALGINDTIVHNGQSYTHQSSEARIATTDWIHFQGGTAKMGVNYNFNSHMNVFVNGGVFFRPPTISDVYAGTSFNIVEGVTTELAWGVELGYSVKYPRWAANLNLYRTTWENRPVKTTVPIGGTPTTINIPNLGSVHQGVEVDAVYKTPWFFDIEGLISYGDWRWKGKALAYYYQDGNDVPIDSVDVDADGVHVGDAAQFQVAGSIKIKPVKDVYIKGQITYFDNYFSNFNPLDLQGGNRGRDSWKVPSYYLLDIHAGWTIKLKKMDVILRASVLNVLNKTYISDADNNSVSGTQSFDATAAQVFMGQGRRWTATVGIKF